MKEKNNWKTIIISALVTGVITVLATLAINYYTSKKSKLSYTTQTSIPFQKDSLNVRIFNLDLMNDGDATIQNIEGIVKFDGQKISDYKLKSSPVLLVQDSLLKNRYKIKIASLNPSEKVTISFLISSSNKLDSIPEVAFRADGLSAQLRDDTNANTEKTPLFQILLAGISIAVAITTLLLTQIRRIKTKIDIPTDVEEKELHTGSQIGILAYLSSVHSLDTEFGRYTDKRIQVEYWSEADYLGSMSKIDKDDSNNKKRIDLLIDLLKYAEMAKESQGIVNYNLAKLYKVIGDDVNSKKYLNIAKEIIPKRISKRLEIEKEFMT